jgi:serine/threonine protein kinase
MKSCSHPNIVKLYEEFETKDEVYLVTDLVKVSVFFVLFLFEKKISNP